MKKKLSNDKKNKNTDELLSEYDFDYSKAQPNRFASRMMKGMRIIILDSDVAKVFKTSESVNTMLRSYIRKEEPIKKRKTVAS